MTRVNAKQKAEALRRFMEQHKYSQAKVAKLLGVSSTQINQFLNDKYPGDLEKLIGKIVDLINIVSRREARIRTKPFVLTTIAKRIGTVIKQTRAFSIAEEGAIALVIGDSGHGKSICLREYAEVSKNSLYITLDDAMSSTRVFSEIARKLGIDASGTMDNVTRRIIAELANREIVIIIDEASRLSVRQLSQLRTVIVDQCRCPLVLAGNFDLLNTVTQDKAKRGCESLDQFRSRLMCILNLDEIASRGKDSGLYTTDDIRKLYEFGGIKLTTDAVTLLRNIGRTPESGRLRTCNRVILALHVSGKAEKYGRIDAGLIRKGIEELNLPVKKYLPVTVKERTEDAESEVTAAKAG